MLANDKILIISDDENDLSFNFYKDLFSEDDIELVYSSSDFEELRYKIRQNYYFIFIDGEHLNMDVHELVHTVRGYLSLLVYIYVFSDEQLDFDSESRVFLIDKSIDKDSLHSQLINLIEILEHNRSLKTISHLPGNYVINDYINDRIENKKNFTVMYIDIDKFKSFTDYYGISKTGQVIYFLKNLIIDLTDKYGSIDDFLGHPGGDDFVIVFHDYETPKIIGSKLVEEFDKGIVDYYEPEDLERGYIEISNRQGIVEKFSVVSVSIVTVSNESKQYTSSTEIFEELMDIKKDAKQFSGSILLESK